MRKWLYITLIVIGFVLVRVIGKSLFYDPLIAFFHEPDYSIYALPEIDALKYLFSILVRYAINLGLTILLVYVIFRKMELVKFTLVLYGILFVILTPILIGLIVKSDIGEYQFLFYVRRMLMHPVLTLIYIPALLYHEHTLKLENHD